MRILVLGATGMAGHIISLYLKEVGHDVTALSRREFKYCHNIVGDVTDFHFLKKAILEGNYDALINAVGLLNEDAEDNKPLAVLLNSYLPHFLSDFTGKTGTRVVHMSTDCVFSGESGRYSESSFRDGKTFYARTKALGELDNSKDLTFRCSIVGPDMNRNGIGLLNWFMHTESQCDGYTKAMWTGVTTLTLAMAMENALQENLTGIYNLVNGQTVSKYELLQLFNKHMKAGRVHIRPSESLKVNKSLINNRTDFSFVVPSYEHMIIEMKEWIDSHRELYPHYFL